jgi:hypothetical protein
LFIFLIDEEQRVQALAGRTRRDIRTSEGLAFQVLLNGKSSILPMHSKELGKGLVETIKKQLGLK